MSTPFSLTPLLVSFRQAMHLLGYRSIDPVNELVRTGRLTCVRPSGKPTGQRFIPLVQIEKIANGEVAEPSARRSLARTISNRTLVEGADHG